MRNAAHLQTHQISYMILSTTNARETVFSMQVYHNIKPVGAAALSGFLVDMQLCSSR
jgi:hypothetical protein